MKTRNTFSLLTFVGLLLTTTVAAAQDDEVQSKTPHPLLKLDGPYKATWDSLDAHPTPQWFKDVKIGYSMHWGPYAVPAWAARGTGIGPDSYSEWYWNRLVVADTAVRRHHVQTYGENFLYDDFIPLFTAENFDADRWMRELAHNGVRYFFITSKHHDGFCLWDTKVTDRNSVKMGPKRDILRELVDAARKHNVKIGFYYSFYEWFNPEYIEEFHGKGWMGDRAALKKLIEGQRYDGLKPVDSYIDDFMVPQIVELINEFEPDFLYFDGEWDYPEQYWRGKEIAAYYYNHAAKLGKEVVLNDRLGRGTRGKHGDLLHVEYHANIDRSKSWALWRGFGNSFGHNLNEAPEAFLTPQQTIDAVVNTIANNGNVEFNVGPTKDGRIDTPEWKLTLAMGAWLRENAEAVYGSVESPMKNYPFGKLTHKPDEHKLFIHVKNWPADGKLTLPGVANDIEQAYLLAAPDRKLAVDTTDENILEIEVPHHAPNPYVSVVVLEYEGELSIKPVVYKVHQQADGGFTLPAKLAALTGGGQIRIEEPAGNLGYWDAGVATWHLQADEPGAYTVVANVAKANNAGSGAFEIKAGDEVLRGSMPDTGGWGSYRDVTLGTILIGEGDTPLSIQRTETGGHLCNLTTIKLVPAE